MQEEVDAILRKISKLTSEQVTTFGTDMGRFMKLDKELELAIGEKERLVGAARQHAKDHKCQDYDA